MTVTRDNIILEMGKAWRRQFADMPLILSDESQRSILIRAGDYSPPRLLAMWIMYIEDEQEQGWGLTIDRFLRDDTLNRWAARLGTRRTKDGQAGITRGISYACEFSLALKLDGHFGDGIGRKHFEGIGAPWPDCLPIPCSHINSDGTECAGRIWREGSPEYDRLEAQRRVDIETWCEDHKDVPRKPVAKQVKEVVKSLSFDDAADVIGGDVEFF